MLVAAVELARWPLQLSIQDAVALSKSLQPPRPAPRGSYILLQLDTDGLESWLDLPHFERVNNAAALLGREANLIGPRVRRGTEAHLA